MVDTESLVGVPGPGAYVGEDTVTRNGSSKRGGRGASFGGRFNKIDRFKVKSEGTPAPGTHNAMPMMEDVPNSKKPSCSTAKFTKEIRPFIKFAETTNDAPITTAEPSAVAPQVDSTKESAGNFKFGTEKRNTGPPPRLQTPGAGSYDPIQSSKGGIIYPVSKTFGVEKRPSPDEYEKQFHQSAPGDFNLGSMMSEQLRSDKPSASNFKFGTSDREKNAAVYAPGIEVPTKIVGADGQPGPGHYSHATSMEGQASSTRRTCMSTKIGRQKRVGEAESAEHRKNPGPGAYSLEKSIGEGGAYEKTPVAAGFGTSSRPGLEHTC
jgi:hypothetical protein